jgi:hypothetical protein
LARPPVITGLTHQHFADLLGTYRETVSATLNAFRDDGLLQTGRKRITLLQPDALRATAHESHASHSGDRGNGKIPYRPVGILHARCDI